MYMSPGVQKCANTHFSGIGTPKTELPIQVHNLQNIFEDHRKNDGNSRQQEYSSDDSYEYNPPGLNRKTLQLYVRCNITCDKILSIQTMYHLIFRNGYTFLI